MKSAKLLNELGPEIDAAAFQKRAALTEKSFYNILKELRLLGMAKLDSGKVHLLLGTSKEPRAFEALLRSHVKDRLRRNRLVWTLTNSLETEAEMSLDAVASTLAKACPYVLAGIETWRTYARVFADWMDFADVAVFDAAGGRLQRYRPGTEVRQRTPSSRGRHSSVSSMPFIQYTPVFDMCTRIWLALQSGSRVDLTGLKPSTVTKAFATLEDLGFIIRKSGSLGITQKMTEFGRNPDQQVRLFAEAAMRMQAFATFMSILQENKSSNASLLHLGRELNKRLGHSWKDGTAETSAKILLDWARHTGLAPARFAEARRGRFVRPHEDEQPGLF